MHSYEISDKCSLGIEEDLSISEDYHFCQINRYLSILLEAVLIAKSRPHWTFHDISCTAERRTYNSAPERRLVARSRQKFLVIPVTDLDKWKICKG